jgi:hypothetical protein
MTHLEMQNNRPDEAECEFGTTLDYVLGANVYSAYLQNSVRFTFWSSIMYADSKVFYRNFIQIDF